MLRVARTALIALVFAACRSPDPVTLTVADIEAVRGGVRVEEGAAGARADTVLRVRPGASVRTDNQGRARLALDEGDRVLLDRNTRVRVVDATHLELLDGRLWVTAAPRGASDHGALELLAGNTALRIRGGRASVTFAAGGTELDVLGGELSFRTAQRQGTVRAGEHASLRGDSASVRASALLDDWSGGLADDEGAAGETAVAEGVGAVAARRPEELGAPRWPLVMQRLEARVRIVGDLAITEMEQTFFNPAADTVEGIYRFHVPRGAVLQRFAVDRHGTLVDGTVQERQRAAAAYQAQVYAGSTLDPALLEWDAPGRYHARLYPIAPGQTRRLLVTYSQWLHTRDDGGRSWRLPLAALGARIGELYVNVDLERAGARDVRAGLGAVRDEQHVVLTRSDITPHADFVVDLRTDTPRPGSLARLEAPTGDDPDRSAFLRVAVRAPMPPGADASEAAMDLVLLVDHSAATPPASLRLQQDLAEALTRALGPEDRLLMLAGDVRTRPLGAPALAGVTPATRAEALDALAADSPGGATDLGAMIDAAHRALDPRRNGVIVYLGDGRATVGEADLRALRARLARMRPRPRLYAVALGDEASVETLDGLAAPAGFAAQVRRRSEVARAAVDILAHASRPLLRDVRLELGPDVERVYPAEAVDLPAGDAVVALGRIRSVNPTRARLRATWHGQDISQEIPLTSLVLPPDGDLRARWATARLESLLARGESRAVVVELGTRFGLITPYTSLYVPAEAPVVASRERSLSPFDLLPLVGCSRGGSSADAPAAPTVASPSSVAARSATTRAPGAADEETAQNRQGAAAPSASTTPVAQSAPAPATAAPSPEPSPVAAAAPAPPAETESAREIGAMGHGGGGGEGSSGARPRHALRRETLTVTTERARRGRDATTDPSLSDALQQNAMGRPANGADRAAEQEACAAGDDNCNGVVESLAVLTGAEPRNARRGPREETPRRVFARCSDAAAVSLAERIPLWTERLQSGGPSQALSVWNAAREACELPAWADRLALLRLIASRVTDVDGQLWLYERLRRDPSARDWMRATILRTLSRSGDLARANALGLLRLDDATLTAALTQARTPAERLTVLRQLARRFRDDLDLSLLLLDAALAANDPGEARRVVDRLRHDPRADARVRTAVGEALLVLGDEAEARRAFSEIVEFAPDDPFARRRLGDIALAHGWAAEAYRQFQGLAARSHDAPEDLLRLAASARLAGRLDEAVRLAERVTAQNLPGARSTLAEAAVAWVATELALAAGASDTPPALLTSLRARWRRSPAARAAGALRVVVRWSHPDDDAELWLTPAGEPTRRADLVASTFPLESTAFMEAPPEMQVEVRRGGGARPRGEAQLVVIWSEGGAEERVASQTVRWDPEHPRRVFALRDRALTEVVGGAP
jgi:Ca-activated chloride channel family protein